MSHKGCPVCPDLAPLTPDIRAHVPKSGPDVSSAPLFSFRASWGALDLLAARETPGIGALMATWGKPAALGSEETKAQRGTLAAQDAEAPQGRMGQKEARAIKATMEPQEVLA